MEVITIESEAYKEIINNLREIKSLHQKTSAPRPLSESWLDIPETCALLKVSKRTLQAYRDKGILSFSQIGDKIYFRASDIEAHLLKHYNKAFSTKK
jgi:hypothetical protein